MPREDSRSPFWMTEEVQDLLVELGRGTVPEEDLKFIKEQGANIQEPEFSDTDTPSMGTMILGGLSDLWDK